MPVVIESEGENARILAIVEKLMNKGEKLSAEEGKLLKLLTRLVQDFEERLYKRSEATPVEVFVTSWKLAR
jgi:antitoxin component HigA of HigAB toxin-antitoxin module